MCHTFFIHSSVNGHLDCFHTLAIAHRAAMNIIVHDSFRIMVFSGYMSSSGIAGLYGSSISVFVFFFFLWLHWVFVSVRGLTLVAASGGHSSSRCAGLSPSWPLLLWSTDSRCTGSVIVAHGPSCSTHVGSSQTKAQTRVPCIGRQILNHCATREALFSVF